MNEKDTGFPQYSTEEALWQIERHLRQMLILAELSASDANVDRQRLQKVFERLRDKIDRIADTL